MQRTAFHIELHEIGDFIFAALRRFQARCEIGHMTIEEIKPDKRPIGAWSLRFLLDRNGFAGLVEFHDAETLRIAHAITEDGRAFLARDRVFEDRRKPRAVEDVIAENKRGRFVADEFASDDKS